MKRSHKQFFLRSLLLEPDLASFFTNKNWRTNYSVYIYPKGKPNPLLQCMQSEVFPDRRRTFFRARLRVRLFSLSCGSVTAGL
jgi:hypothetical protein